MNTAINEATSWLEAHVGSQLLIQKGELDIGSRQKGDTDMVQLQLERLEIRRSKQADSDDYFASHEICLHGPGTIQADHGEAELPRHMYEIPLPGSLRASSQENRLQIATERALYIIQPHAQRQAPPMLH
ncbi:hypothetical protein DUZ99_15375 [Xylanibacillus composti]|uniref:Uncharacterized protein n=1 Tax=Xylanibacillus composti TaxID=1572762 RepID=A0A8J4H454_9BACL|nr:hypothetical protein [Xylanibacillus composti]MDT9726363.1 hypothetical protein [Xylanibacillus composti]GIQ70529.1 hypothetical protein XYCOK13_33530 [Xylanibacillus composti]